MGLELLVDHLTQTQRAGIGQLFGAVLIQHFPEHPLPLGNLDEVRFQCGLPHGFQHLLRKDRLKVAGRLPEFLLVAQLRALQSVQTLLLLVHHKGRTVLKRRDHVFFLVNHKFCVQRPSGLDRLENLDEVVAGRANFIEAINDLLEISSTFEENHV